MRLSRLALVLIAALGAGACSRNGGPFGPMAYQASGQPRVAYAQPAYAQPAYATSAYAYAYQSPAAIPETPYTLDAGDKLRIVVFGQEGLTASYTVDANGNLQMPLIGTIPARGYTTHQLAGTVTAALKNGYIREPQVAVEVEAYRPFFILGEVAFPGQYPYVANMTVETAIAIAGGYSPRAKRGGAELARPYAGQIVKGNVPMYTQVRPGDTITVAERWL